MSLDILKKEIREKTIRNLYLFFGPEEYLKEHYLGAMEAILLSGEFSRLNKVVLEGKADTGKIIDHCETLPVFSERKLVVVKNSGLFKSGTKQAAEKSAAKKPKPSREDFSDYLMAVPSHTCLVFYEEEANKTLKTVKAIQKSGLLVEFDYQKPADLVKWVMNKFKSARMDISPETASILVENCEPGMRDIVQEIEKLVQYLGERKTVEAADIEKVCVKSVKSRIFDLTDAIGEKNVVKALHMLNDMIILKEPLPRVLFMVARQFRQLLQMKLLLENGMNASQAAAKIGINPYFAGKTAKQAGAFSASELKKTMEECLWLDEAIKTGKIEDRVAAELLITGLAK